MNVFGLYSLSYGKFFFDPIYTLLVVWPLCGRRAAGGLVRSIRDRRPGRSLRQDCPSCGEALRPVQNGLVQFYALAMMVGLLVLLGRC